MPAENRASPGPAKATRGGPRPLPGSPCPAPAALHPEDPPPRHGARGRGGREAARGEDADAERGRCLPGSAGARAARVPSAAPGRFAGCWLPAAGCRLQRPRRLEGAALAVARGRLNPLLALPGLGRR